jgi:hypothetical protein
MHETMDRIFHLIFENTESVDGQCNIMMETFKAILKGQIKRTLIPIQKSLEKVLEEQTIHYQLMDYRGMS